jgi:6-phosphogluconate dehydrogenase
MVMMTQSNIGLVGLGTMGMNLALNIESKGFAVAGFDLDPEKMKHCGQKWAGKQMVVACSFQELVACLERPRKILMMVPAGKAVDADIAALAPLLAGGDILIDGGNSHFTETERRAHDLEPAGIRYVGCGVSGGSEGALHGPALMPGGPADAYKLLEPVLTAIAAQVPSGPCCGYLGKGGAGHYVKMVHTGIEYGVMQLISEVYDLMKSGLGMSAREMHDIFAEWNQGDLNSYLIEITATVLGATDPETHQALVDVILDTAGQKGTGKWTSQNALDLGVAIPTINVAVDARIISSYKNERVDAGKVLTGPVRHFEGDRKVFLRSLRDALRLAALTCYAQGFALIREASREYAYSFDAAEIARIWTGGCIIRARLLEAIRAAFQNRADLANLLVAPEFSELVNHLGASLRWVVSRATEHGIPCLGLCASLAYIDAYRSERLPANLVQAQRDFFGSHRYERLDKPRGQTFHTPRSAWHA